jgi:23S rRNA pseudouridine2604 synthase
MPKMDKTRKPQRKAAPADGSHIAYPIRLNHYLALKNYCSRRQADTLIGQGKVLVNGLPAVLGQKVNENDTVTVDAATTTALEKRVYYAYNKPVGIVTSTPQGDERSIADVVRTKTKVFPIGRLDKDSHGLLILTDDGRITDKLLNPRYVHEKEYVVRVHRPIGPEFIKRMSSGIRLPDFVTAPCFVEQLGARSFRIILTEGKKRQIRRMCLALHYEVIDLKRIRIMNIQLGTLAENKTRPIKGAELETFLKSLTQ